MTQFIVLDLPAAFFESRKEREAAVTVQREMLALQIRVIYHAELLSDITDFIRDGEMLYIERGWKTEAVILRRIRNNEFALFEHSKEIGR